MDFLAGGTTGVFGCRVHGVHGAEGWSKFGLMYSFPGKISTSSEGFETLRVLYTLRRNLRVALEFGCSKVVRVHT